MERHGRRGLVVYSWVLAEAWEERHYLDIAVALIDPRDAVTSHAERLAFWPFRHETLDEDLGSVGLSPVSSTYTPERERYIFTAAASSSRDS